MATNNYVSNEGGGFQGPQSDYWMYGLGDMVPARNQAAHEQDQVRQQFLSNLEAQKAKQLQAEWMAAKGERDMAGQAEMTGNQLKTLTNQQGIAEAPLRAKKSMSDIYESMDKAKRDKLKQEVGFLAENGQNMKSELDSVTDPAKKNLIWKKWINAYGGDKEGIENWTPQNEKRIMSLYNNFVDNPEFQRLMAGKTYDHAAKMDEIDAEGQYGIQKANVSASARARQVVSKIRGVVNGKNVEQVTYADGSTEIVDAPEGLKTETQTKTDSSVEGAKATMADKEAAYDQMKIPRNLLSFDKEYSAAKKLVEGGGSGIKPTAKSAPVQSKFQSDPDMKGMKLGKQTPKGYEVYDKSGKLIGHYN